MTWKAFARHVQYTYPAGSQLSGVPGAHRSVSVRMAMGHGHGFIFIGLPTLVPGRAGEQRQPPGPVRTYYYYGGVGCAGARWGWCARPSGEGRVRGAVGLALVSAAPSLRPNPSTDRARLHFFLAHD